MKVFVRYEGNCNSLGVKILVYILLEEAQRPSSHFKYH